MEGEVVKILNPTEDKQQQKPRVEEEGEHLDSRL
jgi:hypothetical protein